MADKPFTVRGVYSRGGSVYYLNGEKLFDDDVLAILNATPMTADGVPLCRLKGRTLCCPRCAEAWPLMVMPSEGAFACAHCNGVYLPHECITYPRKEA